MVGKEELIPCFLFKYFVLDSSLLKLHSTGPVRMFIGWLTMLDVGTNIHTQPTGARQIAVSNYAHRDHRIFIISTLCSFCYSLSKPFALKSKLLLPT